MFSYSASWFCTIVCPNIHPLLYQIELYKTKIKKLQESESEIKALSVNYAALLKEKEVHASSAIITTIF